MASFRALSLAAAAGLAMTAASLGTSSAQVSVSIGAEPACPYGYFDYAPYACAPYGYYGPQWFNGGVFIGAGRWFHGPANFHGTVNNHFDPQHGYKGAVPHVNDKPAHPVGGGSFKGNEERDGRGHVTGGHK
jgi:hypothetical protein